MMHEPELAGEFLDAVLAWLRRNHDPRAVVTPTGWRIVKLASACKDFCRYMAEHTETTK